MVTFVGEFTDIENPLMGTLFNDVSVSESLMKENYSDYSKRIYARSVFSFIEGFLHDQRGVMKEKYKSDRKLTSEIAMKIMLLDEVKLDIEPNGKIKEKPFNVAFMNNCAFVVRTTADYFGLPADEYFSQNGWQEMRKALAVRHRITHPKNASDLTISEIEIGMIRGALTWLINVQISFMNKIKLSN